MLTKSTYLPWLLSATLLCLGQLILAQDFRGKVVDIETKEPLIGACFSIADTELGTCTDADGFFNLRNSPATPFKIKLSYLGYAEQTITISDLSIEHTFEMETSQALLQEVRVVASGSRLKQTLDLTVESMGLEQIKSNAEPSFYDILANMREADMMTVSFGVKVVNTRGFNSSTPVRSLQLIDGVDNASPGLNYALGNFMGVPELDIVGVDLVIGASSAYFGPGAFNGVVNMRTKDPFLYQGLETEVKVGQRDYVETSLRWAKGFKNKKGEDKLGIKLNLSYAYEFGMYGGIEKKVINDKLKLNFAIRMDKHENYDYLVSPAFSASYAFNPKHALRASVSSEV